MQRPAGFGFGRVDSEIVIGRFCDAERGLALFPTACGGLAQLPPDEVPPFPNLEAPSEALGFSEASLVYEGLPEITVSLEVADVTACYSDAEYWVGVRVTVETDGVSFTGEDPASYTLWSDSVYNRDTEGFEPGLRTSVQEFCGDVSASPAWQAVPGATDRLCIAVHQTKLESGSVRPYAEVIFEGTTNGWGFSVPGGT